MEFLKINLETHFKALHTINDINLKLQVFENIKQLDNSNNSVPVVFLTADTEVGSEVKGLNMGAMAFIKKPFIPEVMLILPSASINTAFISVWVFIYSVAKSIPITINAVERASHSVASGPITVTD